MDRQGLLGHKSGRITTHFSAAELRNLIAAANKVCKEDSRKTHALLMVREERESLPGDAFEPVSYVTD